MKKFLLALAAVLTVSTTAFAASVTVLLDGEPLDFEVEPFIEEGTTFVPMRVIFEAFGAEVVWDEDTRSVTSVKDGTEIKITIGSTTVYKNGAEEALLAAPVITEGFTMVPLRFISESFGCDVGWNGETQTVVISTENPLENASIGFVGDSICFGSNSVGNYAQILTEKENVTAYNESKGGSTLSRGIPWDDAAAGNRPSIIDMLDALPDNLDYVILEGGLNDFWGHAALGTLDDTDELTYSGALNALLTKAKADYPYSKIGFIIAHDAFTYDAESAFEPFYERTKEICEKHEIPYLDLYAQNNMQTGVNVKDKEQKREYFAMANNPEGDGVHPNRLGYETIYVMPLIDWLKTL